MRPVVLIIRDGWGENHNPEHSSFNAVKLACTPCADRLKKSYPRTEIEASGPAVGLPEGVIGNSEVGHQNIGAGRIVDQELVRIDKALSTDRLRDNTVFQQACSRARAGCKLHLLGLVSDAGVHAMLDHLYALLRAAKVAEVDRVCIHAFTDGRDTPPTSGLGFIRAVQAQCRAIGVGQIASVCGRFWSMDRDQRWERVERAYHCLVEGRGDAPAMQAEAVLQRYYEQPTDASQHGDEFVPPTPMIDVQGRPIGLIEDGDAVIFYNFRGDRPRELTRAFIDKDFNGFTRNARPDVYFATMAEYEQGLCANVLFPKPPKMANILGQCVSDAGLAQFRCAETEKYPHVTFFFNDYREAPFPGEDRKLIASPRDVATYDRKPTMSAQAVTTATREAILSHRYALIVVNFANPDMVGHTGSLQATIQACETVDSCVAELLKVMEGVDGAALITADHGNADQMLDAAMSSPHTAHTLNPVEVILFGTYWKRAQLRPEGCLADIAPTLLKMMGLRQPREMTGQSLLLEGFGKI